jgi:hypothetical protein
MHTYTIYRAVVIAAMLLVGTAAFASAGDYKPLLPLLIDLKGWNAERATGANMNAGGHAMVTAARAYEKGAGSFAVSIVISAGAAAQANAMTMSFESEGVKVSVAEIDGFKTQTTYTNGDKSGVIVVALWQDATGANGAVATFAFNGMTDTDALALAKLFDWSKLKTAVAAAAK